MKKMIPLEYMDLVSINRAVCADSELWHGEGVKAAAAGPFLCEGLTPLEEAVHLARGIVQWHPFKDGNKRTAVLAMEWWLNRSGLSWSNSDVEKYDFVMNLAGGEFSMPELKTEEFEGEIPSWRELTQGMEDLLWALSVAPTERSECKCCYGTGGLEVYGDDCDWAHSACGFCGGSGEVSPRDLLS